MLTIAIVATLVLAHADRARRNDQLRRRVQANLTR